MGVTTVLPAKVALAQLKDMENILKKRKKVETAAKELDKKVFEKQRKDGLAEGISAFDPAAKKYIDAVTDYMAAFDFKFDDVKDLNSKLNVKTDTPHLITPATVDAVNTKMKEYDSKMQDEILDKTVKYKAAAKPAEVVAPAEEYKFLSEKERKELLDQVDVYMELCKKYNIAGYISELKGYKDLLDTNALDEKGKKDLQKTFAEIEKAAGEKEKADKIAEDIKKAEEDVKEKKKPPKAAEELTEADVLASFTLLAPIITNPNNEFILNNKTFFKPIAKKLEELNKYAAKLQKGQELTEKERSQMYKTMGDVMNLFLEASSTLDAYNPLLTTIKSKSDYNKASAEVKALEAKLLEGKLKKKKAETERFQNAVAELYNTDKKTLVSFAKAFENVFGIIVGEYKLNFYTLEFMESNTGELSSGIKSTMKSKKLKKEKPELYAKLKAVNDNLNDIKKQHKGLSKKLKNKELQYSELYSLYKQFEEQGGEARILLNILEAEKVTLTAGVEETAVNLAGLQVARNEILAAGVGTIEDEKAVLGDAIDAVEATGMKGKTLSTTKILLASDVKDPQILHAAALSLIRIRQMQLLSGIEPPANLTEADKKLASKFLEIAELVHQGNFGGAEPLTKDLAVSGEVASAAIDMYYPMFSDYEKAEQGVESVYASETAAWVALFHTMVALKEKGGIAFDRLYFQSNAAIYDPCLGRGCEAEAALGPIYDELKRQLDMGYLSQKQFDAKVSELVDYSMKYGRLVYFIGEDIPLKASDERAEVQGIVFSILKDKSGALDDKVDAAEEAIKKAKEEKLKPDLGKYEEDLEAAKGILKKNEDFVSKLDKDEKAYYLGKPYTKTECEGMIKKWKGQIAVVEAFVADVKAGKIKLTEEVEVPELPFKIAKEILETVPEGMSPQTYPAQIKLVEMGLDIVVTTPPVIGPEVPDIDLFGYPPSPWPVSPALVDIKSTMPDYTFTKVYTDTVAGFADITEIAGNAEFLYGGTENAQAVLEALAKYSYAAYSNSASKSDVKEAAAELLKVLPDEIITADETTQNKYKAYRSLIESASKTGSKIDFRAGYEGIAADPNVGGGLKENLFVFTIDAKKNTILYHPIGGFAEFWFELDKDALEAIERDESVKSTALGGFIKIAGTYLNYPGSFTEQKIEPRIDPDTGEVMVDKDGYGIYDLVPTGEKYPATIKEAGLEVSAGGMWAVKKAVITFRTKFSIKETSVEGYIPGGKAHESVTQFSLDVVDVNLSLPNGTVFKGVGVGLLQPLGGKVGGEIEAFKEKGWKISPLVHMTFGWRGKGKKGKVEGGIYIQPGIAFFGEKFEGFKPENIIYFGAVHGNIMIKLPKDQALKISPGVSVTSQALKNKVGLEIKGSVDYMFKMGDNAAGAVSIEGAYDPLTEQWTIFVGPKFYFPEKKK